MNNYMSYTDAETMERIAIVLIYLDVNKYAVLKPVPVQQQGPANPPNKYMTGCR